MGGDAVTGECILILWNVTKKDEGTYLVGFPGQRADNQPIQIKIKKDISALLEDFHKPVVNSSLSQCENQIESTMALLETEKNENSKLLDIEKEESWKLLVTEKNEKWKSLGGGFFGGFALAIIVILIQQIISLCCRQRKSELRSLPNESPVTSEEVTGLQRNDRHGSTERTRSRTVPPKWSSAYVIHKVAVAIVRFFCKDV